MVFTCLSNKTSYFYAHLRDPGYIQNDAVFLTQEGVTFSHAVETRRRSNSLVKLRSRKTRSTTETETHICTTSPEMKDKMSEINGNYLRKLQETDGTSQISTNFGIITNIVTEVLPPLDKKAESESQLMKYRNEKQEINIDFEENQYVPELTDNVACEPSMDQGEESFQKCNILNFEAGEGDEVEDVIQKNLLSNFKNNVEAKYTEDEIEIPQQKDHKKEKRKSKKEKRIKIIKEENTEFTNSNMKKNVGLIRIENKESHSENDLATSPNAHSYKYLISPQNFTNRPNIEINEGEPMKSSERSFLAKQKDIKKSRNTKKQISQKNQDGILIKSELDHSPQNGDLEQQKGEKEDEILYIERRYCTVCGFEQPLRAKHCKECERCVAQYDHHCPWLGTCIGEKNHFTFYCFLIFQLIQLSWAEYKVFDEMFSKDYLHWASENTGRIVLACCFTFFLIMVFSLFCYHTYLAFVNLTTWESLSWYKISYLREWNEDWGSPFSQGVIKNIKFFCCHNKKYLHHWEMPKFKRPLDEQDISP